MVLQLFGNSPRNTIVAKANKLVEKLEADISSEMPQKTGFIFDGWSIDVAHYVAIFASYYRNEKHLTPLLAFLLFWMKNTCMPRATLILLKIHSIYNKSVRDLLFVTSHNANTNKAIASPLGVPMIACASHCFNIAVNASLKETEPILHKINEVMKKHRTLKEESKVHKKIHLVPKLRNKTRWSCTSNMLQRYLELNLFIDRDNTDIKSLIPKNNEDMILEKIIGELKDLDSVISKLQDPTLSLLVLRYLFDGAIANNPNLKHYLSPDAIIVFFKRL